MGNRDDYKKIYLHYRKKIGEYTKILTAVFSPGARFTGDFIYHCLYFFFKATYIFLNP